MPPPEQKTEREERNVCDCDEVGEQGRVIKGVKSKIAREQANRPAYIFVWMLAVPVDADQSQ